MAQHMKRITAPLSWKTGKKEFYWVASPRPGRHKAEAAVPLLVVIRDVLKLARTAREAESILKSGAVLVDGEKASDMKQGIGMMDVVSVKTIGKTYRAFPSKKGLVFPEIPEKEGKLKILKVTRKTTVSGGKIQVTFHDGRNVLFSKEDGAKIKTGTSAVFDLETKKIAKIITLEKGANALVFAGVHSGNVLEISQVKDGSAYSPRTVLLESGKKTLETLRDYVIAIGEKGKTEISVPETAKEASS